MSAEAYGAWNKPKDYTPVVHAKTIEQKERLKMVMKKSFLFASLETKEANVVLDAMQETTVASGETIIKEGDDGS